MLLESLKNDIHGGHSIAIVGAGVSIQTSSKSSATSWDGLLSSGIAAVRDCRADLPSAWFQNVESDLDLGRKGFATSFATAGQKITEALGGSSGAAFRKWLEQQIGGLTVNSPNLIQSIAELGIPIATTNFDTLIENVTQRESTTWKDPHAVRLALQSRSTNVIHLHGVWTEPDSIILGAQSYGTVLGQSAAQALEQSMALLSSLIFIGFGSGLEDPNLANLFEWIRSLSPKLDVIHYQLCREEDVRVNTSSPSANVLFPISYGAEFSDLPLFLSSLSEASIQTRSLDAISSISLASDRGMDAIIDRVRNENVLADHFTNLGDLTFSELLIPPVLLPVSNEQFASAHDVDLENRPQRCNPSEEAQRKGVLIIAGSEGAGLTTAIEWLLGDAVSGRSEMVVPVFVDFRSLGTGHLPLQRIIRKELLAAGALIDPKAELPPIILGIDNVSPRPSKIFERMIAELGDYQSSLVVIGCRQGAESEIFRHLENRGISTTIRYLGRLTNRDIKRMAGLVDPGRVDTLSELVMEVTKREHLSRTPFTVGLLLSVLLRGESLLGTASETALLDAYVNLLLGRGDPHDDARFSLDSLERVDILSSIAASFIENNSGSLSQQKVVGVLEEYFDAVGWQEVPLEVLQNLIRRHILSIRGDQIQFAQTSFLHLFSAKKMISDFKFRERILSRPMYFAPIVQHYSALTRDDTDALRQVYELLDSSILNLGSSASAFGIARSDESGRAKSVEEVVKGIESHGRGNGNTTGESEDDSEDWFDVLDDDDALPFPYDDIDDAPLALKLSIKLGLLSTVLRDSELVRDVSLKRTILHDVLMTWGSLVTILEEDQGFIEFSQTTAGSLADLMAIRPDRRERFVSEFVSWSPMLWAYGGISSSLSSRKLLRTLELCFENEEFAGSPQGYSLGTFLAFDIQEPGWAKYLLDLEARYGQVRSVRGVFRRLLEIAYYGQRLHDDDAKRTEDFLLNQYVDDLALRSSRAKHSASSRIKQKMHMQRFRVQRTQQDRHSSNSLEIEGHEASVDDEVDVV